MGLVPLVWDQFSSSVEYGLDYFPVQGPQTSQAKFRNSNAIFSSTYVSGSLRKTHDFQQIFQTFWEGRFF